MPCGFMDGDLSRSLTSGAHRLIATSLETSGSRSGPGFSCVAGHHDYDGRRLPAPQPSGGTGGGGGHARGRVAQGDVTTVSPGTGSQVLRPLPHYSRTMTATGGRTRKAKGGGSGSSLCSSGATLPTASPKVAARATAVPHCIGWPLDLHHKHTYDKITIDIITEY